MAQKLPGSLQSPHVCVVCSLRRACREHLGQEALHNHFYSLFSFCVLIRGSLQQIRSHVPWARSPCVVKSLSREHVAP